jgi:hypothetical protein
MNGIFENNYSPKRNFKAGDIPGQTTKNEMFSYLTGSISVVLWRIK